MNDEERIRIENAFLKARVERMEECLLWLLDGGGLGYEKHDRILEAVGAPNGKFCHQPRNCIKAGRCLRDPVCND